MEKSTGGRMKFAGAFALALFCIVAGDIASARPAQQKIYVEGTSGNEVYVVDVASNVVVNTIQVDHPHGITVTGDGRWLWVASGWWQGPNHAAIMKIDSVTDKIVESYPVPADDELAFADHGRDLYIAGFGTGCYYVFDTVQNKIVAGIETDGLPHNVVVPANDSRFIYLSPMGGSLREINNFVARFGGLKDCTGQPKTPRANDKIYVIDTLTRAVVATISTEGAPRPLAATNDGSRLYVNVDGLLGMAVVDTGQRRVIERVEVPLLPEEKEIHSRSHGIGITPNQNEVWTDSMNHNAIFIYDRVKEPVKFIARVDVGKSPYWITFSPDGKYGYVSNSGDDTVSVVDVLAHQEVKRIVLPKGSSPHTSIGLVVPGK